MPLKIRFFSEADGWTTRGTKITAPENLRAIRSVLEEKGPIIVEHWFYRGASAPDRIVFDDYEDFCEYLNSKACAGDAINIWSFAELCTNQNMLASGKCADDQDRVPIRGAY